MKIIVASNSHESALNHRVGAWVSGHLFGHPDGFRDFCTLSVWGDDLRAGVVFHDYQPDAGTIQLSAYGGAAWRSRRTINRIMGIAFDNLACQMIFLQTRATNIRAVSNANALGFSGHLIPRMFGREDDGWLFTLTDDAWRRSRLRIDNGQISTESTGSV